jgi:tryptophanyl-tRNA synthetase
MKEVETVPGIDGRKMSKSYGNTIPLFAEDREIEEKVMAIVTDSKAEYPENVFAIHKLFANGSTSLTIDKLEEVYQENKGQYKKLKEMLIEDVKNFIRPLREKRKEIAKDERLIKKVLEEGKEKARAVAGPKLAEAKLAIGVTG